MNGALKDVLKPIDSSSNDKKIVGEEFREMIRKECMDIFKGSRDPTIAYEVGQRRWKSFDPFDSKAMLDQESLEAPHGEKMFVRFIENSSFAVIELSHQQ